MNEIVQSTEHTAMHISYCVVHANMVNIITISCTQTVSKCNNEVGTAAYMTYSRVHSVSMIALHE